jgi:hypothetical protein
MIKNYLNLDDMYTGVFAYIDVLGFSNAVRKKVSDALSILAQIDTVLQIKYVDGVIRKERKSTNCIDPIVDKLNSNNEITAFDYFYCISDSIFFAGKDVNQFIHQLANFVLACYTWSVTSKLPMMLFRGGISYGNLRFVELICGSQNKVKPNTSICGEPVVNAVEYEKKFCLKGPLLILDSDVYEKLDADIRRNYISKLNLDINITEGKEYYEILWPAFIFIPENFGKVNEIENMNELLSIAYSHYATYKSNSTIMEHYNSLIDLILRSARHIFLQYKRLTEFESYITKVTDELNTEQKICYKYLPEKFYRDEAFRQYLKEIYDNIVLNKD